MSASIFRVCLPAGELERSVRFYAYLLESEGERVSPGVHHFRLGNAVLALVDSQGEGAPSPAPLAPVYIAVDEPLDLLHQRVRTLHGSHIDGDIRTLPGGETGFFLRDPGGNRIALVDAHTRQWQRAAADEPASGGALTLHKDFLNEVKGGNLSRVRELILLDADLAALRDAAGISAIMHAAYKHQPHVALFLAERAGDIDFWEACTLGQAERVSAALAAQPGLIVRPSPDGFMPLGLACYFGHYPCVDLLLNRGADVNAVSQNARRLRPLHSAVGHREPAVAHKIAHRLILAGADVHAVQQGGYTALHQAADRGDTGLVGLLLQSGARADAAADNGRTPFTLAAAWHHDHIVGMLRAALEAA